MVIVMSGHINGVAVRWGSTVYMYFVSNDLLDSDLPVGYPQFDLQYSRMLWFDLYRGREGGRGCSSKRPVLRVCAAGLWFWYSYM